MESRAFTIIELIFAIVIIGVLTTIAISRFESIEDDALSAVEKSTIGEARQSILSFYGWALLHPSEENKTVSIIGKDGNRYDCAVIFSSQRYPVTVTAKETGVFTDNNLSIGSGTNIGDYKTLAPLMLDPPTIKDWNSTRVEERYEYLTGPATNFVTYENAELKKGMYWRYDNHQGILGLKK
ncbi:type II secretion system protein [Nitrosophilus labii]|uniref:type II secretion system protein n=1 Tax=Nitrosophilus labii TaxID=2706014 RepID=UPI0016570012|nr:prepilin-type N-terminal cleavage/methylation domain-containing protein [Nitrosophilus labii]